MLLNRFENFVADESTRTMPVRIWGRGNYPQQMRKTMQRIIADVGHEYERVFADVVRKR